MPNSTLWIRFTREAWHFPRVAWMILPLLFSAKAILSKEVETPRGEMRAATQADLRPQPADSKTFNEFWTYHFLLDGDMQIFLNFSRANLGNFKSPVCGADMSILGFHGKNYVVAREYPKDNLIFEEMHGKLSVHQNIWFKGKLPHAQQVYFESEKNGVHYLLDLHLSQISEGRVWGDGVFRMGGHDQIGLFIHIPYARVTGTVALNGDTVKVNGTVYMDHTFQTDFAPALVKRGYRYVSHSTPLEVGYYLSGSSDYKGAVFGYGLRKMGEKFELLQPSEYRILDEKKIRGASVATRLEISYLGQAPALLEQVSHKQRLSVLNEFSGLTKFAVKKFMGGEIISYKGLGKLNTSRPMLYNYFVVD